MRKEGVLWPCLLMLGVASCAQAPSRGLASQSDRLRVAQYDFDAENRFLVLGIDHAELSGDGYDFEALSFRGEDIRNLDPKFLLSVTPEGVQEVYAFELRQGLKLISGHFPPKLLGVPKAKQELTLNTLLTLGARTVSGPAYALFDFIRREHENPRTTQAAYLQTLLDLNLTQGLYPALGDHLKRDQIERLAAALTLRYHPYSPASGVQVKKSETVSFYEALLDVKGEVEARNFAALTRVANEQGLIVAPIGPGFAALFYDRNQVGKREDWRNFLVDSKLSPEELERQHKNLSFDRGTLVPMGIFSLGDKHAPLQVLDFRDPLKNAARERTNAVIASVADLGFGFAPLWEIRLGITTIDGVLKVRIKKSGSTVLDSRVRSDGELDALLETGIATVDMRGVLKEALVEEISGWGLPEDETESLTARLLAGDEKTSQAAADELIRLMVDQERSRGEFTKDSAERLARQKNKLIQKIQVFLGDGSAKKKFLRKLDRQSREPAQAASPPLRPVIYFMVDGLRPDRLREAADHGWVPTLKSMFIDRGVEFEAYNTWSISLPNWSTLMTGFELDEHGIRSNTPASRANGGESENLLDIRQEMLFPKNIRQGRTARRIAATGISILQRYYPRGAMDVNFLPINEHNYPPAYGLIKDFLGAGRGSAKLSYGIYSGVEALDSVSADKTAAAIVKHPGQYRIVANWYGAVDAHSHHNGLQLERAMKIIDNNVQQILSAAAKDPVLKDAVVFLVSDHGHLGGAEPENSEHPYCSSHASMHNTSFNLVEYFAGDYREQSTYSFVVKSNSSPEPDYDAHYAGKFRPFSYVYRGTKKTPGAVNALVDYTGDNIAQIYLRTDASWRRHLNFAELKAFREEGAPSAHDIPADLFGMKFRNLQTTDPALKRCIEARSGGHPVQLLAMPLADESARAGVNAIAGGAPGSTDRNPVLVLKPGNRAGLIQTRRNTVGEDEFRYVVVKNFSQDLNGTVHGTRSVDATDDPLGYLGVIGDADKLSEWKSDRQWLALALRTEKPTAIFALSRGLSLAPRLANDPVHTDEMPDFLLIPNLGFNFSGSLSLESDHGGLSPQEVRHALFVSGLGANSPHRSTHAAKPVLSRDVFPSLLDYAGLARESRETQGRSFRLEVETALSSE